MKCSIVTAALIVLVACSVQANDSTATGRFRSMKSMSGVSLGTPGGINFSYTRYNHGNNGYRVTIGGFPGRDYRYIYGLQINYLHCLSEAEHGLLETSLLFGSTEMMGNSRVVDHWTYVGAGFSGRWRFLFAEIALSAGSGTFPSPQILIQVGFVLHTGRGK